MANVNKKTTNNFSKGLIMDFSPEKTGNEVLTHALNATLLTFNGNEMSLLNDMGNARVETAFLPEGYVPVGSCEFGDIIYVVSYNPLIDKALIGCFPSPERNISSEELGLNPVTISSADFLEITRSGQLTGNIKTSSVKKIIFNNDMHPGDLYIVYLDETNSLDWGKYLSDYGNKNHEIGYFPKLFKISIVSIEESGKITQLNSSVKWYNNNYYILDSPTTLNNKINIDSYRTMTSSAYSTFASKVSGQLALLIELEKILGFSCTWECFLPKEDFYIPWVYTGYNSILDIKPETSFSKSALLRRYGDDNIIWTTSNYTNSTLKCVNTLKTLYGYALGRGAEGQYDNLYTKRTNYDIVVSSQTITLDTAGELKQEYLQGLELQIGNQKIILEQDYAVIRGSGSTGVYHVCAKTGYTSNKCFYGSGNNTSNNHYGVLYLPVVVDHRLDTKTDLELTSKEEYDAMFEATISALYTQTSKTSFDFTNYNFNDRKYTNQIRGLWKITDESHPLWGSSEDNDKYSQTFEKTERRNWKYSFIDYDGKIYLNLESLIGVPSDTEYSIDTDNKLITRKIPIYFNFNWITNNKNINPQYAVLRLSNWIKDNGNFLIYLDNSENLDNYTLNSISIRNYNNELQPYTHNSNGYSGYFWTFTRGYTPETDIAFETFINRNYETYANSCIANLLKVNEVKVFSNIKHITRQINGSSNTPVPGNYYINVALYSSNINSQGILTESYKAILDVNGDTILEVPRLIEVTPLSINDDVVNNTFKYPISKPFFTFEIPKQQLFKNLLLDIDTSNFVYEYTVSPAMPYGILDDLAVTGTIDFSKIGKTDINLTKWKYYNNEDNATLTWGLLAYTEPDKGIPEVIFEFYDNLGLAAAYHILNYSSFNGLFTNYLNFNSLKETPGLNNLNWKGEEFFHRKNSINRVDAQPNNTYYYFDDDDEKYVKVTNLDALDVSITTLHESDAGILYSNWLYGVKIIVRYEYKNAIGGYIFNEDPIIFYRWFWTNGLFNKHYYSIEDFKDLLFSLNLDMDINYSIILDNWNLYESTYRTSKNPELKWSSDELTGAVVQHINVNRDKNNINVKINPGLLDTYNTFTLCSSYLKKDNSVQNPLKNIEATITLAGLSLINYPEQPIVKLYSGLSFDTDYQILTPVTEESLTGLPTYVGLDLSAILGIDATTEALDIYSNGRDINKFKNNFCLYNNSFKNTEDIVSYSYSNTSTKFASFTTSKLRSIGFENTNTTMPDTRPGITLDNIKLPDANNTIGSGGNVTESGTEETLTIERYFKVDSALSDSEQIQYLEVIHNATKNIAPENDTKLNVILVTINENIINLCKTLINNDTVYIYKIIRNYIKKTIGTSDYIYYDIDPNCVYSKPLIIKLPPKQPENNILVPKQDNYLYVFGDAGFKYIKGISSDDDLSTVTYRWKCNALYLEKSKDDSIKTTGTKIKVGDNLEIPVFFYTKRLEKFKTIQYNDDTNDFIEVEYAPEDVIQSNDTSIKITINNVNYTTFFIIPIECEINPTKINKCSKEVKLTANTTYHFTTDSNASVYYITNDTYDKITKTSKENYLNYFVLKSGISWTATLTSMPETVNVSSDLDIRLFIENYGSDGTLKIKKEISPFKEEVLQYQDCDNNIRTVNNYYLYYFNTSENNLHSLMSEGLDLALSGVHFSKFKLYTTILEDLQVGVVRPYVYETEDLNYNNLLLIGDKIAFKNMLFFSAHRIHGETKMMGTVHKITGYNNDNTLKMIRNGDNNLSRLSGNNNLTYKDMESWCDDLKYKNMYNFFPVGWGTLSDADNKRKDSFKRGAVTVKLQGMGAVEHDNVSSTSTIGSYIYKQNTNDSIHITDDWRTWGAIKHAKDVLAFLTLVYYLSSQLKSSSVQIVNDYSYLESNYCIYNRDIIVDLAPSKDLTNCNNLITLKGIAYLDYLKTLISTMGCDIDTTNVDCILDSIRKVAPIAFKFNYKLPQIDLGNSESLYYRFYDVSLPADVPYSIVSGLELLTGTPYVMGSNGKLVSAYEGTFIKNYSNATISSVGGGTDDKYYSGNHRLFIQNASGSLYVKNILQNIKHTKLTPTKESENWPENITTLTLSGEIPAETTWQLLSSTKGDNRYITDLPCNYQENTLKYFT